MYLKDFVTIVIPCKNEKEVVQKTLDLLNYQTDVGSETNVPCAGTL